MKEWPRIAIGFLALFGLLLQAIPVNANIPGGGTGAGPDVTLTNNGDGTVTMANGIVTAVIGISGSQILRFTYNGIQVTDGGTAGNSAFYWKGGDQIGNEETGSSGILSIITDPSSNGGDYAEIVIDDLYTNHVASADPSDAHRHFSMLRGSPGIYVTEIMTRPSTYPAGTAGSYSFTCKLGSNIFNWLAQDTGRNLLMPSVADLEVAVGGINGAPKENTLLTNGLVAGTFDSKYNYSGDLGILGFTGWCGTNQAASFGLWAVQASHEYLTSGPTHRETLSQMTLIDVHFDVNHYGFDYDESFAAGETWSKVYGPFLLYFNEAPPGAANPQTLLYADARAQVAAEKAAWPYSWLTDTNYFPASSRGTVAGQIVIADSGNPNASASNLWVGVAQQPPSTNSPATTDFQLWGKYYQFWAKTGANGDFSIPNVIAGTNYTLFVFGPGAIGQFQSQPLIGAAPPVSVATPAAPFAVTVTAGQTNPLGIVTWTPARVGATVWEIGVPDRDATEFRHGNDCWHGDLGNATNLPANWVAYLDYPADFPNGVNYTVGQSRWSADWNYAQPTVLDPTTGSLNPTTQKIFFNLPADPVAGAQAAIYFGFAADFQGPIIVTVNGVNVTTPSTGFFPWYSGANSGDDAMIRMASHGIFCDDWLNFAAGNLHQGQNEIDLQMRNGGNYKYGVNYDYIRLELTGYIPPAPPGLTAIPGNGLVVLEWPASSGATSYNVLRSTTAGADYAILATNVTGPVVGSDVPDATYTDSSVVNGAPYYYVVSAVNPNGQSTNSVEAGATPSSSTPPAPPAPTGLTATAGNSQVILNWSASPGAATYAIQRAPLTIGAVTTSPDGSNPTNVVNSFVTTTNYTDTGLANNVTYAYEVSAANANGQSVNSVAVSATPLPVFPVPPAGFSATVASNLVSLVWTPATNASSYVLQRATSISGPYTTIEDPAWLTMYSDGPLSANTTYYYEIASANLAGISANSAPLTVVVQPAAPVLTADSGDAEVFLNWTASPGATNYVLEGSTTNGGPYSPVISTTNTSDVITGLLNGTTYYYVVYSLGFYGQSPLSAEAAATPEVAPGGFYWANTITSAAQNWNTNANWTNAAAFPNQSEAVAVVNSAIAANQTINLNQAITIGALYLGAPAGSAVFNIAGNGGTLTLDNTPAPATLVELSTANGDTVSTPITVTGGLQITNASSNTLTLSGGISGAVNGVSVSGNTLLSGSNTYTGGTVLNQGTLVFSLGAAIPASGALTLNNTGAVTVATASSLPDVLVNGANAITGNGGSGTGIATLNVAGTLTLLVAGGSDVFDLTGPMSGSGGVVLGSSPMTLRFNGTAGDGGAIFNLGTGAAVANVRKVVTTAIALGGLAGGSGTQLQGDNNPGGLNVTYTIGGANANTEFDGVIKDGTVGAVALTKTGASALLLTGMNNYSGGTTIGGGMLIINNTAGSGTGSGAVTVSSGGALGGTGLLSGAVTVNSGGLLAPGNPPAALTFGKSLTLAAGSTTLLAVCQSPLTNSATVVLGGLTNGGTLIITNSGGAELKGGDTFTLLRAGSYSGAFAGVVLPPLNPALAWKTNLLNTAGTVSVVVATQPLFQPLSTSPQGLVFAGSNGPANALYCLLSSTNPAALLSNWTPVVTNFFDAGGDFNFTNPPAPGQPQQFFILEIP